MYPGILSIAGSGMLAWYETAEDSHVSRDTKYWGIRYAGMV